MEPRAAEVTEELLEGEERSWGGCLKVDMETDPHSTTRGAGDRHRW